MADGGGRMGMNCNCSNTLFFHLGDRRRNFRIDSALVVVVLIFTSHAL